VTNFTGGAMGQHHQSLKHTSAMAGSTSREQLLAEFGQHLAEFRIACGKPTYAQLRRASPRYSLPQATVSDALNGRSNPRLEFVEAYVAACVRFAAESGLAVDDAETQTRLWRTHWRDLQRRLHEHSRSESRTPERRSAALLQLPSATAGFVGRSEELRWLSRAPASLHGSSTRVLVVTGAAGMGKTMLALTWANSNARAFPDGQLYADLQGAGPRGPKPVAEVLAGFLIALGATSESLPLAADALAAVFRGALTGKRLLILLDNVGDADDVRPFIPGSSSESTVLATSRSVMRGLVVREGALRLHLGPLPPRDALTLLAQHSGMDGGGLEVVAKRCAYLPLALRIAAERLQADPTGSSDDLPWVAAPSEDRDDYAQLSRVFDWSLARWPVDRTTQYRLLGYLPVETFDTFEVAAHLDVDPAQASALLDTLVIHNLLEPRGVDVYGFHALLQEWATRTAPAPVRGARHAALTRLCSYYLWAADAADRLLLPARERPPLDVGLPQPRFLPKFSDAEAAAAWVRHSQQNLVATSEAVTRSHPEFAVLLPHILMSYFNVHKPWHAWIRAARAGLSACNESTRHVDAANVSNSLGIALREVGETQEASAHFTRAMGLYTSAGETVGAAMALNNSANLLSRAGNDRGALVALDQAAALLSPTTDPFRLAVVLHNRAERLDVLGEYDAALQSAERALALSTEVGDADGTTITQVTLAQVLLHLGRVTEAIGLFEVAISAHQQSGNRLGEAEAHERLSRALARLGHTVQADQELLQASTLRASLRQSGGE